MILSIITINYNNAAGLKKTIESVVNQKFDDFEYIIIDGASTDGSLGIIEDNADKINFWISEKDSGIYNAMNKGIKSSKGEYLLFLNSGDWLVDNNVLNNVFSYEHTKDILVGWVYDFYNDGKYERELPIIKESTITLSFLTVYNLPHQATFIKKDLFDKYGLYNENYKLVSDWAFFIEAIGLGLSTYEILDIPISFFEVGGVGTKLREKREYEKNHFLINTIPVILQKDLHNIIWNRNLILKLEDLHIDKLICSIYLYLFKIKTKARKFFK